MWRLIDTYTDQSSTSAYTFDKMSADDLNNVFVNLSPNTVKYLSPRNDQQIYLKTVLLSHCLYNQLRLMK